MRIHNSRNIGVDDLPPVMKRNVPALRTVLHEKFGAKWAAEPNIFVLHSGGVKLLVRPDGLGKIKRHDVTFGNCAGEYTLYRIIGCDNECKFEILTDKGDDGWKTYQKVTLYNERRIIVNNELYAKPLLSLLNNPLFAAPAVVASSVPADTIAGPTPPPTL